MRPAQILVVDDEAMLQAVLRRIFERAGYAVATVGSADAALDFLAQTPVPMVISDFNLGGRDGLSLLAEVKERWPGSIRLVLTADMAPALMDAIARCDVHRCVSKPFDVPALEKLVGHLFAAFQAGPAAAAPG